MTAPADHTRPMQVRAEQQGDQAGISSVLAAAFRDTDNPDPEPVEAGLVAALRASVRLAANPLAGCHRHRPSRRASVVHPSLGRSDAGARPGADRGRAIAAGNGNRLAAHDHRDRGSRPPRGTPHRPGRLTGDFSRFGFVPGTNLGITPPTPDWDPFFQVKPLDAYRRVATGRFEYAEPFSAIYPANSTTTSR